MTFMEGLAALFTGFFVVSEYIMGFVIVAGFIWLFCEFVRVSNPSAPL